MKRFVKICSLLLAVSLVAALFVSCKKNKGDIIAVYNDTPVYEADVDDLLNYKLASTLVSGSAESQLQKVLKDCVTTYVQFLMLEHEFNAKGIYVDEKKIDEEFETMKKELDETFEGGYSAWREAYGVSKNFLKEEIRRYVLAEMYYDIAAEEITVTDEEAKAYYNANGEKYFRGMGYYWSVIFREVKDITDETECNEAKAEVQDYITKLQNGSITWEKTEEELLAKYTVENGYDMAVHFNGESFTYNTSVVKIDDLDAYLAKIGENYPNRDPKADEKSKEYEEYMTYIGKCFEAESYYALQNLEAGEIYAKPVKNFIGYAIIRLDSYNDESYFVAFEDVKAEIAENLKSTKIEESFSDYLSDLEEKYEATYLFEIQLGK